MTKNTHIYIEPITVKKLSSFCLSFKMFFLLLLFLITVNQIKAQSLEAIKVENVTFKSEGVILVGTIYKPKHSQSALVVVHGSGQEPRMTKFAELLAKNGITVLTYDKRGVGESGGDYAGPEVGSNNIDSANLNLLARDASAAVNKLHEFDKNIPIGLVGGSQAGWIIPIAASNNTLVQFMVLFSCPTITTLEQLRFQFYTNGNTDFWENHSEAEAREHIKNDSDRYQFTATDPKSSLNTLSIPGLWLFGEKDIQIPAKLCIEQLKTLKVQGKPFEYTLFPTLGHNTAFATISTPFDISIQWIKQKALKLKNSKVSK
jgi:uncharacterized protein